MTEGVSVRQRLAVFSVALGTFTLVTNEFLPVALLTGIRTSLRVSQEAAATMVTVPAVVAAIASPALAVAAGRLDRRLVLLLMAGLFTVSDAVSAAAPNFATMLLGRFLLGGGIGGFWAIGASIGGRLVPAPRAAWAASVIFLGSRSRRSSGSRPPRSWADGSGGGSRSRRPPCSGCSHCP
jgi:predicted MFS family arabinose efflux permease